VAGTEDPAIGMTTTITTGTVVTDDMMTITPIQMQTAITTAGITGEEEAREISDERKKRKKMQRDMLLTSGLATVATIHAAHGLYSGVQKRKKRLKQLEGGEITPEEARKARVKANALDAVSVGLAALGVKGAYKEWKEVNEKRKEERHFRRACAKRAFKRQTMRSRSQGYGNSSSQSHRWPDEIEYNDSIGSGYGGASYRDGDPYGATTEAPRISY